MKIWKTYEDYISGNFRDINTKDSGLPYWRDYLFVITITYIIPFSLIALIPGIIASLLAGFYAILVFDVAAVILLALIAFSKSIPIAWKKVLFICIVYVFAIIIFEALGSFGPGLVYLLAVSIFMIIIFPERLAFLSVAINIVFCTLYGINIYFEFFAVHPSDEFYLVSWVAISSNLIFLNGMFSILIPRVFKGMQDTLNEQLLLKNELKSKQESLEESLRKIQSKNEELETFAYTASHDLQEPLRMITSFLNRLETKYGPRLDDKAKQYIFFAVDGARRMKQVILDLLEYSRVGKENISEEIVNVQTTVEEAFSYIENNMETEHVTLHYSGLPVIKTHRILLLQVFQNLISNAIKYCPKDRPPEIFIRHRENQTTWEFSVEDNGIGIEKEFFDKIFVIFQRLHDKNSYAGTGIGLAIVKKIAQTLGGDAWVTSEVGKGSTFYFSVKKH
ncbi:MAG TPA: ATP-binding protein [Lunatimonas sp.]|nr:ATP-binding protein [Lunatimonas sp.]